ncbi:kinase-like domain-containing protein [Boletus edulis]|nr:kinase-like domain-containing protein [Boletus edulis]
MMIIVSGEVRFLVYSRMSLLVYNISIHVLSCMATYLTNVLICENGSAYISDYGLSMLLTELGGSTFATPFHVWGTLRWTAPELLDLEDDTDEESSRVAPTTQSDVYSFGSIMLQILSGKVPYHYYKHELQVLYAISKGKTPLRPSGIARQRITERQWMFIQQCWSTVNITRSRPSSEDIVEFTERQLADWHTWWLSFLFSARCRSYSLAPPPHSPPEGNNRVLEIDNETGSAPSSSTSDDESSSITDNDLDLVCSYGIPTSCCYPQTRAGRVSLPVATDTSDSGWSSNDLTNLVTRESHDPVASGGFADIYRGMLQQDNGQFIKVAIKAIKTYLDEDDNLSKKQRRLRREIKVWLDLSHDNILPLLGTTMGFGRFPAMVCPWVENGTLTVYLKHCYDNLSVVEILVLLNNVAYGLQYLHSCSIVHGDLSGVRIVTPRYTHITPLILIVQSNILIHGNGRACIADFGLSMVLTEFGGSTFTASCHARGTLRWIAPELLDLEISEDETGEESPYVAPTTQSDVYSFGSIMLQILSGQVPYHYYKHDGQVVLAISKGKMPRCPSSELVTERRWTFIQRCWSTVDIVRSRPSSEGIVAFIDQELVDCRLREILTPTALEDVENPWPPAQVTVESTATRSQLPPDETSTPVLRPPQPLPSRETVIPGVIVDPWHRSCIPVESIATSTSPHLSPDDPTSNPAPTRSPLGYHRQHQHSGQRGSIPNTIVELPSQPETIPSESTEPESPELVIS